MLIGNFGIRSWNRIGIDDLKGPEYCELTCNKHFFGSTETVKLIN